MEKIVIVGLGLIGGSIAKALKASDEKNEYEIFAIDTSESALLDAQSAGVINAKATQADIESADIIYLCVYPDAAIKFIEENADKVKKDCIITDTCGIKQEICAAVAKKQEDVDFTFIAAHPMAGKEKSGFTASDPSIFSGASYIIAKTNEDDRSREKLIKLAQKMGFGKIIETTPEKHDEIIAFTSQVPHVLACAYVMSPRCAEHTGFSAGSYRDVSRVADINSELWANLFLENRENLTDELDELIGNIEKIKISVKNNDKSELKKLLDIAGEIKRRDNK